MKARLIRLAAAVAIPAAVLMMSGCGTVLPDVKPVNANAWAKDYYNQPNVANIVSLEGPAIEITIKGATKIALNTPVPVKSVIPRDPGVLDSITGLLGQVMPWLGAAYIGGKLADRPATVQPAVVEKQVLVPIEGAAAP
jgi:hypothetical protein